MFPSPKGGGSIEAFSATLARMVMSPGFHRRKAVAPLKQHQEPSLLLVLQQFPSPKGGGSIED